MSIHNINKALTSPDLQADANFFPFGLNEIHKTQFGCPSHVLNGNSVVKSHNRTVLSPDPEANVLNMKLLR